MIDSCALLVIGRVYKRELDDAALLPDHSYACTLGRLWSSFVVVVPVSKNQWICMFENLEMFFLNNSILISPSSLMIILYFTQTSTTEPQFFTTFIHHTRINL